MVAWLVAIIHVKGHAISHVCMAVTHYVRTHVIQAVLMIVTGDVMKVVLVDVKVLLREIAMHVKESAKVHAVVAVRVLVLGNARGAAAIIVVQAVPVLVKVPVLVAVRAVLGHVQGLALDLVLVAPEHVKAHVLERAVGDAEVVTEPALEHVWGLA